MGCRTGGRCPRSTGQEAERSRRRIAHCSGRGACGPLMALLQLDCVLHVLHVRVRECGCQGRASGWQARSTERSPDVVSSSITCRMPRPGCGCVAGSGCSVAMRNPGHPVPDTRPTQRARFHQALWEIVLGHRVGRERFHLPVRQSRKRESRAFSRDKPPATPLKRQLPGSGSFPP